MTLVNVGPERFDVWAPDATSVILLADGRQYPMQKKETAPGTEGWWSAPDAPAGGGWRDTAVELPVLVRDELTGAGYGPGPVSVNDVLGTYPVALLVPVDGEKA